MTNANGIARCDGIFKNIRAALSIRYLATFRGSDNYNATADEGTLVVLAGIPFL